MKRIGKILLVPATTIKKGRAYVGCLHGDKDINKRSYVIASEGDTEIERGEENDDAFNCRFKNGNTYPFFRKELFQFVFEYDVPSLANPRKSVGKNQTAIADGDYEFIIVNHIGAMSDVEVIIDFDANVAKLLTKEIGFSLGEVVAILESMKNNDTGELSTLEFIDIKIAELKAKYNG